MNKASFEPIAIVGQGCILPGALSANSLWRLVADRRVVTGPPPPGHWRIDTADALSDQPGKYFPHRAWSDIGGYVHDFDSVFDPLCYDIDPDELNGLDAVFKWSLAAADQALSCLETSSSLLCQTGLIMGNLSYPSAKFAALMEEKMIGRMFPSLAQQFNQTNPLNRFMSGYPAQFVAKMLNLGGDTFALDAACASGLYAIKIACDRLHSHEYDLMLAGAVNASDPLFLHIGFCALNAKSLTGQTRPFNRDADGLIPAEGAAFVVLKRLDDAISANDTILGVIRGISLTNDGKAGGFLSPSQDGQVVCINRAIAMSGLQKSEISLVECHATGTKVGDRIEINSMKQAYSGQNLVISSLKANLGHTITASGVAGLVKVLGAMQDEKLPATPNANPVLDEIADSSFKVLTESQKWQPQNGRFIAAVSSFGFGGNNAHLIVERWDGKRPNHKPITISEEPLAVVGMAVRTHNAANTQEFTYRLFGQADTQVLPSHEQTVDFSVKGLSYPPKDLQATLGQQLILLEVVKNALESIESFEPAGTGIFIGMGTDPEISRFGMRARLNSLVGDRVSQGDLQQAEESCGPHLDAAAVIGAMPNIPANRLNNQFDCKGPGFTISCEELSGIEALRIAMNALRRGEIKTAIVGAVDLCREPSHEAIMRDMFGDKWTKSGDAAVVLIIRRQTDAIKSIALIDDAVNGKVKNLTVTNDAASSSINQSIGHTHAASGILHVTEAIIRLQTKANPAMQSSKSIPEFYQERQPIHLKIRSLFNIERELTVLPTQGDDEIQPALPRPYLITYAASDREGLLNAIKYDEPGQDGNYRCALVCYDHTREDERQKTIAFFRNITTIDGLQQVENMLICPAPVEGKIATMFTGAASSYQGMGRDLILAYPELIRRSPQSSHETLGLIRHAYDPEFNYADHPFEQLIGSYVISQLQAIFLGDVLKLKPDMTFGLSSGETNSIYVYGIWRDIKDLYHEIEASQLYADELAGSFKSVREYWGDSGDTNIQWANWRVFSPIDEIKALVNAQERVYISIINSADDAIICGDQEGCRKVVEQIGADKATLIGLKIAIHCPPVKPFEERWRKLHTRKTYPVEGIRIYSNFFGDAYEQTTENVATALTGQAVQTVDFPAIVNKVYDDGARIFIEHGPRKSLCASVNRILADRPHVAISFDDPAVSSVVQAYRATAALWCIGADVDLSEVTKTDAQPKQQTPKLSFKLRKPPIPVTNASRIGTSGKANQSAARRLEPAPELASVFSAPVVNTQISVDKAIEYDQNLSAPDPQPIKSHQQLLLDHHRGITEIHQQYLNQMQSAQNEFITSMIKMQNTLLNRAGASVAIGAKPELPVTKPISGQTTQSTAAKISPSAPAKVKPSPPPPKNKLLLKSNQPRQRNHYGIVSSSKFWPRAKSRLFLAHCLRSRISMRFRCECQSHRYYSVTGSWPSRVNRAAWARAPSTPKRMCCRIAGISTTAACLPVF